MRKKIYLQDERPKVLSLLEALALVAVTAAMGLFLAGTLFFSARSSSRSMEPTIEPDMVVFVNRITYSVKELERFDVVAFRRKSGTQDVLVRRVIGLPGETVRIYRGTVYIDDIPLDTGDLLSEITSDGIASDGIRLGEGEYFFLGDTPANSEDSRSSSVGVVRRSQIIGKVWIAFRSITQFRLVK